MVTWKVVNGELKAVVKDSRGQDVEVAWAPQPGSQEAFLDCPVYETLYAGTRGPGKALRNDQRVLTPEGWVEITHLVVGQKVVRPFGGEATIVGVYPQGQQQTYEVEFKDGRTVACDAGHLWFGHFEGVKDRIIQLPELLRGMASGRRFFVPTTEPVDVGGEPPVDPYLLGLLLGDGSFRKDGSISYGSADPELHQAVLDCGFTEYAPDPRNGLLQSGLSKKTELWNKLASLGLLRKQSYQKAIPEQMLVADKESRLLLLQGLMDTGGYAGGVKGVQFGSASRELSEGVIYLARSLGGVSKLWKKKPTHRPTWMASIQHGNKFNPFKLERKRKNVAPYMHARLSLRINNIKKLETAETTCIKLDSDDGLFLTEGFTVTHNTDALLMDFGQHCGPHQQDGKGNQISGWGREWRGVLFRQTYPQLSDIVAKTKKWFPRIWPQIQFNEQKMTWKWTTGEELLLRHMQKPQDYYCVPGGEVLTKNGWQPIEETQVGMEVFSAKPNGEGTWAQVEEVIEQEYDGVLHGIGTRDNIWFTPNHRLPIWDGGEFELVEHKELSSYQKMLSTCLEWGGEPHPPLSIPFIPPDQTGGPPDVNSRGPFSGEVLCEFLGWYLSEGFASSKKKQHGCGISQSQKMNPQNCEKIRKLLTKMQLNFTQTDQSFIWKSKSWCYWLRHFGKSYDKYIPFEVRNATIEQLRLFFNTYVEGDGRWRAGVGGNCQISTASKVMCGDLTEIGLKLGYKVTHHVREPDGVGYQKRPLYFISFSRGQFRRVPAASNKRLRKKNYQGKVYCLRVKDTGCFFLRQNNTTWLSGNSYHGHSYPWIGWEELTTWPNAECYTLMMSCSRSTVKGMPRKYRATTNPYGVGHSWVKMRWRIRTRRMPDILGDLVEEPGQPERICIHGYLAENQVLLQGDPLYEEKLRASARNPAELSAWLDGSWDIVAGGMFDDVWKAERHVVKDFKLPNSWTVFRAFDWGSSKPFSVGWWARSDGSSVDIEGQNKSTVPGDLFRVAEWYGWTGQPNVGLRMTARDIAEDILRRERNLFPRHTVVPGPADSSIWDKVNNMSIAEDMEAVGCYFHRADKSPGSRKQGWEKLRSMLKESAQDRPEEPGLYVLENCQQFIRTLPTLPRAGRDPDDVDTDAEDHIGDETRYVVLTRDQNMAVISIAGR